MNPMNEAWTLLKGNPSMRDAQGRAINHPAAMVYDSLASRLDEGVHNLRRRDSGFGAPHRFRDLFQAYEEGEEERMSDVAERMRKPRHQMRIKRDLKRGGNPTSADLRIAQQRDREMRQYLNRMRADAKNETSHDMAHPDPEAGPNYGIDVSTGTDARMKQGNIMEQM